MTKKTIKVGSRDSQLALWQTNFAISELKKVFTDCEFEVVSIKTKGDKVLDVSLSKIGDKGLFTNELEAMMSSGEIDMAVHSLKDMPSALPENLALSCYLARYDHRDALLSKHEDGIMGLPENAIVGTSSLRRASQLRAMRPDLEIRDLRGNVNTRLRKYHEGEFDAVILAVAGLERLGLGAEITEKLSDEDFVPAVGQGALVIESRVDDAFLNAGLAKANDPETAQCVLAERQFMTTLDGGCQVPMGAYARMDGDIMRIHGFVGAVDGSTILHGALSGASAESQDLGKQLAELLLEKGAGQLLEAIRRS
ncbi:MAG: hydroxymethylbilane synthase [Peptococcaceae bacterium]|nr:hydroxymethylbilane synthase [Peptococcaceae bacterium]